MLTREEYQRLEERNLAPYAFKSRDTMGRLHPEQEHPYRSCYQRDRDRIVHSTAFRRLEYKTQVFVNHEGDYYRTRLTHTLEVAQIARSIARILRLNEDLTEAIALAHDLGHTPFGHSGEDALKTLMKRYGGFDHNTHGLRVVDMLEERYPQFRGLNLSWEVREGIVKHSTAYDNPPKVKQMQPNLSAPLETQVVDIADEIAYDTHDLDDGLTSGLLNEHALEKVGIFKEGCKIIDKQYTNIKEQIRKYQVIKYLINLAVSDLSENSYNNIKRMDIRSADQARRTKKRIISFSKPVQQKRLALRNFLKKNLYEHYKVVRMSNKAQIFVKELFRVYLVQPGQLPPTSYSRIKQDGVHRVICDYIAGMTDRYAQDEYKKLFQPYERV
jgi:dGTPase